VHREQRRLDRERDEEPGEQPAAGVGVDVERGQVGEEVRRRALLGGDDVQPDHRGQQHQAAGELEHQELQRSGAASLATEAADEEVGGDQGRLEHDVEEEHVGRAEHRERECLEREDPREERARPGRHVLVGPLGDHHDRHQQHGEQHQQQAEAVDAEGEVHPEGLDPVLLDLQLHAAVGVELDQRGDADAERAERERRTDLAGHRGRHERDDDRAEQRERDEEGQRHPRFTARSASTTRRTPPSTESA
jgi:hypothetical protein